MITDQNDLLDRLDARAVLAHFGAENCTEHIAHDGTTEIIHSCLLDRVHPHHANGDRNPSACLNVEKKKYVCFSWGRGCDLATLVARLQGDDVDLSPLLRGATLDDEDFATALRKKLGEPLKQFKSPAPTYSPTVLTPWLRPHPYWTTRGVTDEAMKQLSLGYDEAENRVVIPHFMSGKLVGWQKRLVSDGPGPKYRSSQGFPKSTSLYNLDTAQVYPKVCVVESPMSVIRAVSLGIPTVVATFGAKVSEHQADLLHDFETVYVWFDRDKAGWEGQRKLVGMLARHTEVKVVIPDESRDMADCTLEEIERKIGTAQPAWRYL